MLGVLAEVLTQVKDMSALKIAILALVAMAGILAWVVPQILVVVQENTAAISKMGQAVESSTLTNAQILDLERQNLESSREMLIEMKSFRAEMQPYKH